MVKKIQEFNVYELVVPPQHLNDLFTMAGGNSLKEYFVKKDNFSKYNLPNKRIGIIQIIELTDTYLFGSYSVAADEENKSFKSIDLKNLKISERPLKETAGYFPLFFLDFMSRKLFIQKFSETPSFKDVFNRFLSKGIALNDVFVENPKEHIRSLFSEFRKIEIKKLSFREKSPDNNIVDINKQIDPKIEKVKETYTIKQKFRASVSEIAEELINLDLVEFEEFKLYGVDVSGKQSPTYDLVNDTIKRSVKAELEEDKFLLDYANPNSQNKHYIIQIFQTICQEFQQSF